MAKKKYDEVSVVRSLSKKNGININRVTKSISVQKDNTDVGNGSWGKIDFLTHYCGYTVMITSEFVGKKHKNFEENTVIKDKTIKRENKLNMAAMTKAAMKKAKVD